MATADQSKNNNVANLPVEEEHYAGKSLWMDAMRRLSHNYMAILGIVIIILFILIAIFAEQLAPKGYEVQVLEDNNAAPLWIIDLFPVMTPRDEAGNGYVTVSDAYPIGADGLGRDMLSRIIYGTRISLAVAFIGPLVALIIGVTMGLSSGFFGGRVDNIIMRAVDIFYAFPTLLLIILLMAYFRGGFSEEPAQPADYPRVLTITGLEAEEQITLRIASEENEIYDERHTVRDDGVQNVTTIDNSDMAVPGDYTVTIIRGDQSTITDTFELRLPEITAETDEGVTLNIAASATEETEMTISGLQPNEEVLVKIGIVDDDRSTVRGRMTADENGVITEVIDSEGVGVPADYIFTLEHGDDTETSATFVVPEPDGPIELALAEGINGTIGMPEGPSLLDNISFALAEVDRGMGGMLFIFIGIGLTSWVGMARLTRGQVLSVREQEYIVAAQSIGASKRSIMWKHVLPNILGPIIVAETLTIPTYIRYEAFLSFIGLGVNRPTPSWGSMISDGARSISSYPHQAIFPAIALFLIMFAFNFLGDGLRDALDPRMRGVE